MYMYFIDDSQLLRLKNIYLDCIILKSNFKFLGYFIEATFSVAAALNYHKKDYMSIPFM